MTKIVFMGTPDFSVPILRQMIADGYEVIAVVTQPDRPVGRKRVLTPPPVKVEAVKQGIPVYQPEKISRQDELTPILKLNPDLIVTAAFGQILPNELLDAPTFWLYQCSCFTTSRITWRCTDSLCYYSRQRKNWGYDHVHG